MDSFVAGAVKLSLACMALSSASVGWIGGVGSLGARLPSPEL